MDPVTSAIVVTKILSDDLVKRVFAEILKNRRIEFKELRESLDKTQGLQAGSEDAELEDAVEKLKQADLIKERTSEIKDFNSYWVTAGGLTAGRKLASVEREIASSKL